MKKVQTESSAAFWQNFAEVPSRLSIANITTGFVAAVFGCTGPALIVINSGMVGGLSQHQIVSWLFGIYFFGGLIGVAMALAFRQPICGAFTIPGAVLLGSSLTYFNLSQAVGAYLVTGALILVLGLSGIMDHIMQRVPLAIVMATIAGVMLKFALGIVLAIKSAPIVGGLALAGYFLLPKVWPRVPPVLGAIILGVCGVLLNGNLQAVAGNSLFYLPQLVWPEFSPGAILAISIPLTLLVLGSENAQGIGVLLGAGYPPPINFMTVVSGVGTIVAALFGAHSANIAGVMTAICATQDNIAKEDRYGAAVVNGVLFMLFGLFAGAAVQLIKVLPGFLISLLAGLAMVPVLIGAMHQGFSGRKFKLSTFAAFVIALSEISLFKISAPFWALLGGLLIALTVEKKDFQVKE
ncbi:MAG: benzoate/H(+) symporter BenE family transporter [Clostridia bacterium]|nr:benzoate/H(+) symporter BenE family transporter [Clostridia bacterium]